ncbi:MAG: D-tyrosyl-tRNA(Tyr) deacylase [Chloroflexi bacterium]|nr:D-tyrosyl-tRNA(Tyr) deacylase [Chloroflexota bacterium]
MRAVVQRVSRAQVTVDDAGRAELVGEIGVGLLVYLGIGPEDGEAEVRWMATKVAGLRLFPDDQGRFDRSVSDVQGSVLIVSQFTLYGEARRRRRPSFTGAASPEVAEPLIQAVVETLRTEGLTVASGRFGAHMMVDAVNDGPVTIFLDTADLERPRERRS